MHPNLSFDQAPPISVPLRFFLSAPWFGVLAGLLLAVVGGDALSSRWSPYTLALVHLITVGFMLQAMCGALLQLVPVVAGGNVRHPRRMAAVVHPLLLVAALQLVAGFLLSWPGLWLGAALCFVLGIGVFAATLGLALMRTPAKGHSLLALRLAVIGLVVTVGLGAVLAEGLARGRGLPFGSLTDIHLTWGLAAWALALVAGVSYLVVPMFQLTPSYPVLVMRSVVPLAVTAAIVLSLLPAAWVPLGYGLLLAAVVIFGATTLYLQRQRKRRLVDATFLFFRIAMIALLAFAVLGAAAAFLPVWPQGPRTALWLGVLALQGVFLSAVSGMLYKIVPFLVWLHLQRLGAPLSQVPNMKTLIADRAMRGHLWLHLLALILMLGAVAWEPAARAAGVALALASAWLGVNLAAAARRYVQIRNRIRASVPGYGS